MPIDSMLFKKKNAQETGREVPAPANPPPSKPEVKEPKGQTEAPRALPGAEPESTEKDITEILQEAGYEIAFDIPAREVEPTEESIDESIQEEVPESTEESSEGETKEVTVFENPKVDSGPVFKDKLEKLDSLINSELGISAYTIDMIRENVKVIMMDLVTQPELDSILIDRDVHNVLAFIRHVKNEAAGSREVAKVKKETKTAKSKQFAKFDLDLTALGAGLSTPLSLPDLSKFK